jgi:hypothetical protein
MDKQYLSDCLTAAPRDRLLEFLATLINELTVHARAAYDEPDEQERMRRANEAIHRLSGHLRDLADQTEPMTRSRADAVVANMAVLHAQSIARVLARYDVLR